MSHRVSFGRYQLLDRIAVGGMAELFLASAQGEAGFSRLCAIKRVLPHLTGEPSFIQMFLNEARLAARLHHPGIIQIFDLGKVGEDYFIAMEYLAGEDVSQILRRSAKLGRRVSPVVAAKIISLAADALHYAHDLRDESGTALNVVHRDISPSNLLVTYQGTVKVLDFGIARAESLVHYTAEGEVRGKVAYMSPEQVRGDAVDRRADVWALGVCLYELLTGARPFGDLRGRQLFEAVQHQPIRPPSQVEPTVPEALDELVLSALERDVDKRLQSADLLRSGLEAFISERTYVSQTVLLSSFLRELFGAAHIQRRMTPTGAAELPLLGTHSVHPASTESQTTAPSSEPMTVPIVYTQSLARTGRWPRGRWAAAAALAASAVLGAFVWSGAVSLVPRETDARSGSEPLASRPAAPDDDGGTDSKSESPKPAVVAAPAPSPSAQEKATAVPAPRAPQTVTAARKANPSPPTGVVSVVANHPGQVWLNGKPLGALPLRQKRLPVGRHRLRVTSSFAKASREEMVVVSAREERRVEIEFAKGRLNVFVKPWADARLDGVHIGQTPLAGVEVWEGQHELELSGSRTSKSLRVAVRPNEVTVVREALE